MLQFGETCIVIVLPVSVLTKICIPVWSLTKLKKSEADLIAVALALTQTYKLDVYQTIPQG